MAGLDIGVHRSDRHAQLGKLTRQGSAPLRWALFEAAQFASHRSSPDSAGYHALKNRGLSHNRATMTIARELARRSYHPLRRRSTATTDQPSRHRPPPPAVAYPDKAGVHGATHHEGDLTTRTSSDK